MREIRCAGARRSGRGSLRDPPPRRFSGTVGRVAPEERAVIDLRREGDVFVLRMDAGENRFHPDFVKAWNAALDEVEGAQGPKALVTTGSGKFYSNGLDLDWMLGPGQGHADEYLHGVLGVIGRVLVFPAITVAAVNGHAFGAGAQLAVAHDLKLMRSGRGFFCMPEIDMKVPLHPGMTAILAARLRKQTVHEVIVTGKRYTAEDARARQIVDEALPEEQVLPRAVALAAGLAGKAHPVMSALKRGLYEPVLKAMAAKLGG
jgi:enoyl-CoA hydratase/carnithine racemase